MDVRSSPYQAAVCYPANTAGVRAPPTSPVVNQVLDLVSTEENLLRKIGVYQRFEARILRHTEVVMGRRNLYILKFVVSCTNLRLHRVVFTTVPSSEDSPHNCRLQHYALLLTIVHDHDLDPL